MKCIHRWKFASLIMLVVLLLATLSAPLSKVSAEMNELEIVGISPSQNRGHLAEDDAIHVLFNHPIHIGKSYPSISVHTEDTVLQTRLRIEGNRLIIEPLSAWPSGGRVSVYLPLLSLENSAGVGMMHTYTHSFQVIGGTGTSEAEGLLTRRTMPASDEADVEVNVPLYLQFSKVVKEGGRYADIQLIDKNQRMVPVIKRIQDDLLWIIPEEPLEYGADYEVSVPMDAVRSVEGEYVAEHVMYAFTTVRPLAGFRMMSAGEDGPSRRTMSAGSYNSMVLKADGSVWIWGDNQDSQLGTGSYEDSNKPVPIPGLEEVVSIEMGSTQGLALRDNGTVWSWGYNQYGEVGDGTTITRAVPVPVKGMNGVGLLNDVVALSGGNGFSVALKSNGTVWSWGDNRGGELGDGTYTSRTLPVQVVGENGIGVLTDIIAIDASQSHIVALQSNGTVWSWGRNYVGSLGDGTTVNRSTPVKVKGPGGVGILSDIVQIQAGVHSMALTADGKVWSWGANGRGQLGDDTTLNRYTPVAVLGMGGSGLLSGVSKISAGGGGTSMAVRTDGTLWSWGNNAAGALGIGSEIVYSRTPVQVRTEDGAAPFTRVADVSIGMIHATAVTADGEYWGWGANYYGQLGIGHHQDQSLPVRLTGLTGTGSALAKKISLGYFHSVAANPDGTVWSWGGNFGDGSSIHRNSPVQAKGPGGVGVLSDIVAVSAGTGYTIALKSDGTVWAWGENAGGQLGDGATVRRLLPVQVKGPGGTGHLSDIIAVSAGMSHSVALKLDGTVWAWGRNMSGQLGNGTFVSHSSPVQVKGIGGIGFLTNVKAISAGDGHTLALGADGTVWSWGSNMNGQLGDGQPANSRTTPVNVKAENGIGVMNGIAAISAGGSYSIALKTDGTVRSWGENDRGTLGDGTQISRSLPVQVKNVGGSGVLSQIVQVSAGSSHSTALKSDGTAVSWGNNYFGAVGEGTWTNRTTPVQVKHAQGSTVMTGITTIVAGGSHTAAMIADKGTWTWGFNEYGQLGHSYGAYAAAANHIRWPSQYMYDTSNRLTSMYIYKGSSCYRRDFHYDANGNLLGTTTTLIY